MDGTVHSDRRGGGGRRWTRRIAQTIIDDALAVSERSVGDPLAPSTTTSVSYVTSAKARSTPGLVDWMFGLTKANMQEMYDACPAWGWDDRAKREELDSDASRFVLVGTLSPGASPDAFVHMRYELEGSVPVVYVYEIQVDARRQGRQLGRRLMAAVESLARSLGFPMVMLTVFSGNERAKKCYEGQGYLEDSSSPEEAEEAGYLILSKQL